MNLVPIVTETVGRTEKVYDIFSRLLKDRIIFINSIIDDDAANILIAQMLFLQMEDPDKDISLYINSPGGTVTAGIAIYDTMQFLKCDINTYAIGQAASMAAILLSAGTKGKRYSLPHARIMIHQPAAGMAGSASDISIQAEEIMRMRDELNNILVVHTGKSIETIVKDTDRDFYMSANEAVAYGLIDHIIDIRKKVEKMSLGIATDIKEEQSKINKNRKKKN